MDLKAALALYGLLVTQTFQTPSMAYQWIVLNNKHWMAVSGKPVPAPTESSCGPNMVPVEGGMKQDSNGIWGTVDQLQKQACLRWIERRSPLDKCATYDRNKWLELSKNLKTRHMKFCIDKFSAPNVEGQFPMIMISLDEATPLCAAAGKRLCTEDEIVFAAEGEEALPYGYGTGYERNDKICVFDKPWRAYHGSAFRVRNSEILAVELDHLWQGEESGARADCVSVFGLRDFPGNVDQVTRSTRPGTSPLALKGGYFAGHVRNRVRATTRSHSSGHYFYQEGFRCCKDL